MAADLALIPDAITLSVFIKQGSEMLEIAENVLVSAVNKIRVKRYVDERRQDPGSDKAGEEAALSPDTPKEKEAQLMPVFLTLADVEKALLSRLVNYGDREITVSTEDGGSQTLRLDEFVFRDLASDNLTLETPLYHTFYNIYGDLLQQPSTLRQQLQGCPEEEIQQLYVSLQDIRPSYSPNWKKRKSIVHTVDDQEELLRTDLLNVLHNLRLMHLRKMKEECSEALKMEHDEEECLLLLSKIKRINEYISLIEKKLGVTYR